VTSVAQAARGRELSEAAGRVSFIELFFDLVFVFAITQVSHLLLEHLTWSGAAETAFVLVAVWWTWITVLSWPDWVQLTDAGQEPARRVRAPSNCINGANRRPLRWRCRLAADGHERPGDRRRGSGDCFRVATDTALASA